MVVSVAAKNLGAYYTDGSVASFLTRWAIRSPRDSVMDPSFGDGVFLNSAANRITALGGNPGQQIYGVEIDPLVHRTVAAKWSEHDREHLLCSDFFTVARSDLPKVDAIVGNPPFIRYQRFAGDTRHAALARARDAGVVLSQLSSSWAPFLVHAAQFVKPGGRLAMVAPAELAHAAYAAPLLEFLRSAFSDTLILTFGQKLFPHLSEDTLLILASGRGGTPQSFSSIDLLGPASLDNFIDPARDLPSGAPVGAVAMGQREERLLQNLLPKPVRDLYRELRSAEQVVRLDALADVGIGYVSGHNDFFHLTAEGVKSHQIPEQYVRPAVRRGAELAGLRFTRESWQDRLTAGGANLLLHIKVGATVKLPESVVRYLSYGTIEGVHERYKCRTRTPWYAVPNVYVGDAFLTYMSGEEARLVANEADAVAPNTLHVVRLRALPAREIGGTGLAALWHTSLTALSCEIEGHSLGGGMLKLEPAEAARVLVGVPQGTPAQRRGLSDELDHLLRTRRKDVARLVADKEILQRGMRMTEKDVRRLREGVDVLRNRRLRR